MSGSANTCKRKEPRKCSARRRAGVAQTLAVECLRSREARGVTVAVVS